MAQLTTYHVKTHDDGWSVEATGSERPSAVESRKTDAVERAREIAQNQQPSRVIVHKQDGSVQNEFTYGDVETVSGDGRAAPGAQRAGADAAYALMALANDALQLAGEALKLARDLPSRARERGRELGDLKARRDELNETLRDLRRAAEKRMDERSAQGRTVADDMLSDERIQRVLDQAKTARSQVKAAITSIGKTGQRAASGATRAGKEQAETARSQVKAAATSMRKTAETAADAGKDAAGS